MCRLCKKKKQCDLCQSNVFDDLDKSIYCFECGSLFCFQCANLTYAEVKKLNSASQVYFCNECSIDYYCLVCKKVCNHGCIMCNNCKSWIHFRCTKMTKKQINRFSRTDDQYYCAPCISTNLPYSKLDNKELSTLNTCDEIQPNNVKTFSIPDKIPNFDTCNLCMECNLECTKCLNNSCADPQRICDTCCDCKYADIDQFNKNYANFNTWYKNSISFMHFNIRSLDKNKYKITSLLQTLDSSPDIMMISETKLQKETDKTGHKKQVLIVKIKGYTFYPTFTDLSFGGTGVYVADGLDCTRRIDLDFQCDGCETTFIEIPTPGKQKNIIIGAIYRHPHDNHDYFFSEFYSNLKKVSQKFSVILLGDFNIDVSPKAKNTHAIEYKKLLFSLGLRNMISKPTRITEDTETVIDHVITNLPNEMLNSGILIGDISDHLPVYALCSQVPCRK